MGEDARGKVSAGSYDLNKWLFGGYEKDVITVLYGGPGTGKTNFCLLASVSLAKKGKKVIFIDTEGGFSSERVKQIAPENSQDVLKNILLLKPTNFNEQKKAFEELLKSLKDPEQLTPTKSAVSSQSHQLYEKRKKVGDEVSLIVVDGMTILYRLAFAAAREEKNDEFRKINSELARQMRILAELARKKNIPVLVTNQVYKWEDAQRMVAGDILKYWGKCLIELANEKGRRFAYLRKHRSLPEKELEFVIVNEGIKKRGFW